MNHYTVFRLYETVLVKWLSDNASTEKYRVDTTEFSIYPIISESFKKIDHQKYILLASDGNLFVAESSSSPAPDTFKNKRYMKSNPRSHAKDVIKVLYHLLSIQEVENTISVPEFLSLLHFIILFQLENDDWIPSSCLDDFNKYVRKQFLNGPSFIQDHNAWKKYYRDPELLSISIQGKSIDKLEQSTKKINQSLDNYNNRFQTLSEEIQQQLTVSSFLKEDSTSIKSQLDELREAVQKNDLADMKQQVAIIEEQSKQTNEHNLTQFEKLQQAHDSLKSEIENVLSTVSSLNILVQNQQHKLTEIENAIQLIHDNKEKVVSAATEEVVTVATVQVVSAATEQVVSAATEQVVSAATEQVVSAATEQVVSAATEQVVSAATEQVVSAATEQVVSAATEQVVSAATEQVVSAVIEQVEPVPSSEEAPVAVQEEAPVAVQEEASVAVQEEAPVAVQEEAPVAVQEEAPVAVQEEASVAVQEEAPVAVQEEAPVAVQEEAPVAVQEEAPVAVQEEAPVVVQEEAPVAVQEEAPVAVQEEAPVAVQEEAPVAVQEEAPVAVQEEAPVTVQEEAPVTVQEEAPVAVQEEAPVAVQEEAPVAVQEEAPVAVQEEAPEIEVPMVVEPEKKPCLNKLFTLAQEDEDDQEDDIELIRVNKYFVIKDTKVVMNVNDGTVIGYLDDNNNLVQESNEEVKQACSVYNLTMSE